VSSKFGENCKSTNIKKINFKWKKHEELHQGIS
jgi:hypothetical protein